MSQLLPPLLQYRRKIPRLLLFLVSSRRLSLRVSLREPGRLLSLRSLPLLQWRLLFIFRIARVVFLLRITGDCRRRRVLLLRLMLPFVRRLLIGPFFLISGLIRRPLRLFLITRRRVLFQQLTHSPSLVRVAPQVRFPVFVPVPVRPVTPWWRVPNDRITLTRSLFLVARFLLRRIRGHRYRCHRVPLLTLFPLKEAFHGSQILLSLLSYARM